MALLNINQPSRAPLPQQFQKKSKEELIDKILKGLSAVQAGTGIAANVVGIRDSLANTELKQAKLGQVERQEKGILTEPEIIDRGFVQTPEGQPSDVEFTVNTPEGGQERRGFKATQKNTNTLEALKFEAQNNKTFRDFIGGQVKDFNKKNMELEDSANKILATRELISSDRPIQAEFAKNLLVKLSGDVGAITESDREVFGGSPDILSRLDRLITRQTTGTLTPNDKEDLLRIVDVYAKKIPQESRRIANRSADQIRGQAGILGRDLTNEEILKTFLVVKGQTANIPGRKQQPIGESKVPGEGESQKSLFQKTASGIESLFSSGKKGAKKGANKSRSPGTIIAPNLSDEEFLDEFEALIK